MAPSAANASTYRWELDANGDWNNPANWVVVEGPAGAGYPNLPADVAVFDVDPTAHRTITIPDGVTITVGRIEFDENSPNFGLQIARAGTGILVLDNAGEDAVIVSTGGASSLALPIQLNADLVVSGRVSTSGISESGGSRNLTLTSGDLVMLSQANSYTGTTTIADGSLTALPSVDVRIPGVLIVGDGVGAASSASFSGAQTAVNPASPITVNADGSASFGNLVASPNTVQIGAVTVHGGKVAIDNTLSQLTMASLTMEGGVVDVAFGLPTLIVSGDVTATSTAAGPARIFSTRPPAVPGQWTPGMLKLPSATNDFTVADGPQPVDFIIDLRIVGANTGESLRKLGPGVAQLTAVNTYTGATQILGGTLQVNGTQGASTVSVDTQAVLEGTGTVGAIATASQARVSPGGDALGILRSGSLNLVAGSVLPIDIAAGTAGSGYDQIQVTGTVTITSASLVLRTAFLLPANGAFTIIQNDGADAVAGTFDGLPEGASITAPSGATFVISYLGGDGNDVELVNNTPLTYFLSEGATGTFFDEDLLIANPNTAAAPITMTFFLTGGGTNVQQRVVPAKSRLTVNVNEIPGLETTSPSVEVRSDNRLTLAVDRTMFWDRATHYGGHTANAVPRPEKEWLFAEGVQNDFFHTFLLLGNPNNSIVTATVTFLREGEPSVVKDFDLPARSRVTVDAADHAELVGRSFGMTVKTPLAIGAERAMYFASSPTRPWTGGHANEGSSTASTSWFHPEGASGVFFNTFILISNPQDTPAEVTYKFLLPDGESVQTTRTIQAKQRLTLNPVDVGDARLLDTAFSTVVTSDVPVVSERAMYWPGGDTPFGEGHASSGLTTTSLDWLLAEGRVGGPSAYTTYILLANPQNTVANVTVTFLRETGDPIVKNYTVDPTSRFNIDVGGMVPELQNESFGTRIEVTNDVPIAVERSMYWNAEGRFWAGGSNALGSSIPR
jgi:autotransporter-associated beta strand protein